MNLLGFKIIFQTIPVDESFFPEKATHFDSPVCDHLNVSQSPIVLTEYDDPIFAVFEPEYEINKKGGFINVKFKPRNGSTKHDGVSMVGIRAGQQILDRDERGVLKRSVVWIQLFDRDGRRTRLPCPCVEEGNEKWAQEARKKDGMYEWHPVHVNPAFRLLEESVDSL